MATNFNDDLRLALVLADDADSLTTDRFKAQDLHVMNKPDLTPVTDADKSVEEGIRRTLSRSRPRDAVVGEEQGSTGHSQRRWVVDPIDGTKNYVRGVPVWATLIALMVEDEVVVGCVSAPQLNRRWWASNGGGAWSGRSLLNASPCRVSDVARLEDRLNAKADTQSLEELAGEVQQLQTSVDEASAIDDTSAKAVAQLDDRVDQLSDQLELLASESGQ